ncbi:MAG: DegT/DnrJ/EryC1/StrS aminotransferase family protein [Proteobacteria bacterium]|nr:DegT/DnrJ/EryC1/StrS aminotransferase family protein [Pseudomonadota bacterium]
MNPKIFPSWPYFGDYEIEAVEQVLRSGKVNQWTGSEVTSFEKECADFVGVKYAVALTNGSVALELALEALGIGVGDEVIVTCYTFIASASAVVMRAAVPVMADIDPGSLNISADTVRAVISSRTRAIIAVHLAGMPCDMYPLLKLAKEYDLKVIEDCAQAHGATYKGRAVGSLGDAAAFSFCQDKIMTTGGEGGLLTTNDKAIWEKAWAYKDHGKSYDSVYHKKHPSGFCWLHDSFGTNWRMTEMQAAIGRVQLRKLPEWTAIRQRNAAMLTEGFAKIPALRVLEVPEEFSPAYYKYYVFVRPEKLRDGWDRDRIMNAIVAEGIPCFSGSCSEIYLEKAFVKAGIGPGRRLPAARKSGETSMMFLVHPTLGADEMRDTCRAVEKVMRKAQM